MNKDKARRKYKNLLLEAKNAPGRKEAVRLIHIADKLRIKIGGEEKNSQ